jgi:glycine C-acetyltransferase
MDTPLREHLRQQLDSIRQQGLFKKERVITSPQSADIDVAQGHVINFCANNYLGLANHPAIVQAATEALQKYGYGMASVRFICGTQTPHKELEQSLAKFLGMDDAILYSSCFDANGGLFETLMGEEDAVISDELNHASIIDGVRLCKSKRFRYKHSDMAHLEECLKEAQSNRMRLVVTDGVFSMDGDMAKLPEICDLCDKYQAVVVVDDSHATGFMGKSGKGTPEELGCLGRIDIITSTLGKALGGAMGGFTAARQEIVDYLRQRSRPYLFSNTLPPAVAVAAKKAVDLIAQSDDLRQRLHDNAQKMREGLTKAGFTLKPGRHPILPIMLGDAKLASAMADAMLQRGIYVIGFSFPVVPQGQARIRLQLSAAHSSAHIEKALQAFTEAGKALGVLK